MAQTLVSPQSARAAKKRSAKDVRKPLNLRVRPEVRLLIDYGAELMGKNLTDFVLDAARQAAQNALLDRTAIAVNAKAYNAFVAMLDTPPNPNVRLRRALEATAVWE